MKKILVQLHQFLSPELKRSIGKSTLLKPIRSLLLRRNGEFRETAVCIKRSYYQYDVNFRFFSSIQIASKAKARGIENTLIKNSISLLKKCRENNNNFTIFDVGSNFGYLSLTWATTIASKGKVIAFEPNSLVVKSLRKSIAANKLEDRIIVENVALGNENGNVTLYNFNTTSNTLESFDTSLIQTEDSKIIMIRLDDYVQRKAVNSVDLLKIDVDGSELEILKGAKYLIQKYKPLIIVEVNEQLEIIHFLKELNYLILNSNLENFNQEDLKSNLFCVPIEYYKYL